jgi:RHS repeat-associated protein
MDDKRRIALVEIRTQGNDDSPSQLIRYEFNNHLGSASLELDDRAQIISYEEYYPYGSTSYQAVDQNIKAAAKRYRFTGKERDEESGLYYHGARYYAPWIARWTSCDPLGIRSGINLFAYANNSPLRFVDANGMSPAPAIPAAGLPVDNLQQGLTVLDELNSAPGNVGDIEWFLGEQGGKYTVFKLEGSLGGKIPTGYNAVAHTHPGGAMITAEDVATTTAQGIEVGGVRTHLVSKGNNRWGVIEVPKKGPATLTEIDLQAGRVSSVVELQRVGTGPHGLPHIVESGRSLNQPSGIKTTGELADAMEGATPLGAEIAGGSLLSKGSRLLGEGAMVVGAAVGGWQIGSGITEVRRGQTGEGVVDISEGTVGVGLSIGVTYALKAKLITAGGGGGSVLLAGTAAAGSLALAFEEIRRSVRGEKSLAEGAVDYWKQVQEDELTEADTEGKSAGGAFKYVGARFGQVGAGVIHYPRKWITSSLEYILGD